MPDLISSFSGEFDFLSNFYPSRVVWCGREFASVEHAFQAAKTLDKHDIERIRLAPTPGKAKRIGRQVELRPDWEHCKRDVMRRLLFAKFAHPHLWAKLLATGEAVLVEGNTWGDRFWGVCGGVGSNHLGLLLMQVRNSLSPKY